ncbi:PP2C family protein-serine/threonine phosphatase, partial [Oligoflexus tunisiensis]
IFLLDENFFDFTQRKHYSALVDQTAFAGKILHLIKQELGFGYLGELIQDQREYLVAYYRPSIYPVYLLIHLDASAIQKGIQSFIFEMLKWTLLFLLVAVLIAKWMARSLVRDLRGLHIGTQQLAAGRFDHVVPVRSDDEIGQLSASFNLMTQRVLTLMAGEREKARLGAEIATAQVVQNAFFKDKSATNGSLRISSFYQPAAECGGDWWGRFSLAPGKELIVMGDATGKGVPAALVTAIAYTTVHIHVQDIKEGRCSSDDPAAVLKILNDTLYQTLKGVYSMTFLAAIMDSVHEKLIFANGGHPFPVFIPTDASDSRITQPARYPFRFLIQKNNTSNVLGLDADTRFTNEVFAISPGDRFILHSRGLVEVADEKRQPWGNRGLERFLKNHAHLETHQLCQDMISHVIDINAQKHQFADDFTIVFVDFVKIKDLAA